MKKQKIIIVLMIIIMIIPNIIVFATNEEDIQWTDFSNAKIEIIRDTVSWNEINKEVARRLKEDFDEYRDYYEREEISYSLKIDNVQFNEESKYNIFLSANGELADLELWQKTMDFKSEDVQDGKLNLSTEKRVKLQNYIAESRQSGNPILMRIVEENSNQTNEVLSEYELDVEIDEFILSERVYLAYLPESKRIYVHLNEPYQYSNSIKANIRLGKVDDTEVLLGIKKEEEGAYEKLMDYAVSDEEILFEKSLTLGMNENEKELTEIELEDKAYYYTYIEVLDDEDESWNIIRDVSLYQAWYLEKGGIVVYGQPYDDYKGMGLVNMSDANFEWIGVEEPKQEEPEKPEEPTPTITPSPSPTPTPSEKIVENVAEKVKDNTIAFIPYPNTGEFKLIICIIIVIIMIGVLGKLSKENDGI